MTANVPRLPIELDPLIDEANARKRRRRFVFAAGLAALVALSAALTLALRQRGPESPRPAGPTAAVDIRTQPEARTIAESLLQRMTLPPGARRVSEGTGKAVAGHVDYGTNIFTQYEYRHAFWRVRMPFASVVAFIRKHPPATFTVGPVGNAETYPYRGLLLNGPSVGGRIPDRILVSIVPSHGAMIVRVDAGVVWTVPRSPLEVVPATVRAVKIHTLPLQPFARRLGARPVTRLVTDPREVALIVRWFNALNVVQPNTFVSCQVYLSVPVKLTFRSGSGAQVASAVVRSTPASSCTAIQFTLHGQPQTPLIDSTPEHGMAFIYRVQRLVGARLVPRYGR